MNIRNFCIIAHIDHGKSTLADRMLEITGTIKKVEHSQMLDRLDIEQERGITIKLTPARMQRKGHELNLIDTPGHVDFAYEVSRSLAAVEGAILLVDASQGVQAQTLSVLYQALENNIEIIPVLNKIDLPAANPERVAQELEHLLGVDQKDIIKVSGKTGENVEKVLDAIIDRVQNPHIFAQNNIQKLWSNTEFGKQNQQRSLTRALIFDSVYDKYRGVVCYVKVLEGTIKADQKMRLIYSETNIIPTEVGYFTPEYCKDSILSSGQIGYIVTGQKSVRDAKIGDTVFLYHEEKLPPQEELKKFAIPGFKKVKPYVYAGVFPLDSNEYEKLRDAFDKISLNDSAVEYEYENSHALGFGLRAGFLGMLHMDIIKERIRREYNVETIFTIPNVVYLVRCKSFNDERIKSGSNIGELIKSGLFVHIIKNFSGKLNPEDEQAIKTMNDHELTIKYQQQLKERLLIRSGADMPPNGVVAEIYEPFSDVEIVGPKDFSGSIMELCQEYRGSLQNMEYIDDTRVLRRYVMPLGEIIVDFYDKLKSATKGYATMNYEFKYYGKSDLVKLDIYINGEIFEAFCMIVHKDKAYQVGRDIVERLKKYIPKHLFSIPLQAGVGGRMIARETIPAMSKDVLSKCYGGDVSRKRKLLEKQKEGKKRMKAMGSVNVPHDIFIKMVTQ